MNFRSIMVVLFFAVVLLPPMFGLFYAYDNMEAWESIRSISSLFQIVGVSILLLVVVFRKRFFR